jgi:N-methylhydantoinase B
MEQATADGVFMSASEIEDTYGIDVITAETLRAGLIQATRHMNNTLKRSAFSNAVRELEDFGVCVHAIQPDGSTEMVAISEGCTHFAFTHPSMTNMVVDEWGLENLGPGDTLVCNDPWRGSIHIPDVNLFRPVFWEGEPVFILSDASHMVDMGGPIPGSYNNEAREVYAEGLRLPPMLITSGDQPVRSTISLILENSRTPQLNLGDLRALFGTMKVGEGRIVRLLEKFGVDAVRAASRYTLDLAERRMRNTIRSIPDGQYEAEELVDDDGVSDDPVRLFARATVKGGSVELDFSGTDRQPLGPLTTCWEDTNRVLIGAKVLLDPNHPMNAGALRPFDVLAPGGTVVMGLPPTSSSQHVELGTKIASLALKIFGQMVPELAVASDGGTTNAYALGGVDKRKGREERPFGLVIAQGIGWGGTPTCDGISFCSTPIYGIASSVIELMERDAPIVIRGLNLIMDSAGAGEFRAGFPNACLVEAVGGEATISMQLDSGRYVRPGAAGGGPGPTSYLFTVDKEEDNTVRQFNGVIPLDRLRPLVGKFDEGGRPDPERGEWCRGTPFHTTKITGFELDEGDVLLVMPAGGGGYGNPAKRDPEAVRLDVWNERISVAAAERLYGVVMDPKTLEVDSAATKTARDHLLEAGDPVPVSMFEPWPETWADLKDTPTSTSA